jgi:membrane-associated phospholipid phosphatase
MDMTRFPAASRRTVAVYLAFSFALAGSIPRSASAQTPAPRDTARASRTLFTWRDGVLAGVFTGLTFAMFPVDKSVAQRLQNPRTQSNQFFKHASQGLELMADPGSIVIGVSLYGVGRITKWREVADLGLHGTEAVVFAGVFTSVLKDAAGRARPYVSVDTSPHDFSLGRGTRGSDYQSFPSGHTSAAFAAAAAVTSESRRWWPGAIWVVGPAMYGGATLVGLSRMYHNRHWASDVVLGAGIGTFSGLKTVRYTHGHPHNFIDRVLLSSSVMSAPNGDLAVGFAVAR